MSDSPDYSVVQWLYEDAEFLKRNGRTRGCLCLLLCLVDGLAKRKHPSINGNRQRYTQYLKEKLAELGIDQSSRVEEKGSVVHLSDIIYEYFRCNMVHEGDSRESLNYEVQVEYEETGRFISASSAKLMDRVNKKLIYRADWLINVLFQIADNELKNA